MSSWAAATQTTNTKTIFPFGVIPSICENYGAKAKSPHEAFQNIPPEQIEALKAFGGLYALPTLFIAGTRGQRDISIATKLGGIFSIPELTVLRDSAMKKIGNFNSALAFYFGV